MRFSAISTSAPLEVNPLPAKCAQLADAQASGAGQENQRAIAGMDGLGETDDLWKGELHAAGVAPGLGHGGHPGAHLGLGDRAQRPGTELWQDPVLQVTYPAVDRGGREVHAHGHELLGPVSEDQLPLRQERMSRCRSP